MEKDVLHLLISAITKTLIMIAHNATSVKTTQTLNQLWITKQFALNNLLDVSQGM